MIIEMKKLSSIVATIVFFLSIAVFFIGISGVSHANVCTAYKSGGGCHMRFNGVTYAYGHTTKKPNPNVVYSNNPPPSNDTTKEIKAVKNHKTTPKATATPVQYNVTNNVTNNYYGNGNTEETNENNTTPILVFSIWECYDYGNICYSTDGSKHLVINGQWIY